MNEKIELGCLGIVLAKVGTVGNGQCDLPVAKVKSLARLGMKCLRKTSLLHPWRRSQFLKSLWHPWKWRQCLKWRVLLQSPLGLRKQVRFASTSMQHGVLPQAAGTLATNIGREVAHFAASNQANLSHEGFRHRRRGCFIGRDSERSTVGNFEKLEIQQEVAILFEHWHWQICPQSLLRSLMSWWVQNRSWCWRCSIRFGKDCSSNVLLFCVAFILNKSIALWGLFNWTPKSTTFDLVIRSLKRWSSLVEVSWQGREGIEMADGVGAVSGVWKSASFRFAQIMQGIGAVFGCMWLDSCIERCAWNGS